MDQSPPVMTRGQNVALPGEAARLHVVVGWSDTGGAEVDLSALLLDPSSKVRSDADMVFYNQPVSEDGAVRHQGNTMSDSGVAAKVAVDLEALDTEIQTVALIASIDGGTFGEIDDLSLLVLDGVNEKVAQFDLSGLSSETAVHLGELYRRDGWRFRAVGQGWASGLGGLATDFGIEVADESGSGEAEYGEPAGEGDTLNDPSSALGTVPVTAAADLIGEPTVCAEAADGAHTAGAEHIAESPSQARPPGVRTKRAKPIRVAAPVLADEDGWQPARLFSVSGVGAAQEQEKRATSALLSSMVAVRKFGRAITAHLGAPAGPLETFLEVPFSLGEQTVRPDGVIKVVRAGRVWTALVEVKTGTGQLRVDQVEHYLDVARNRGYDAVVTI